MVYNGILMKTIVISVIVSIGLLLFFLAGWFHDCHIKMSALIHLKDNAVDNFLNSNQLDIFNPCSMFQLCCFIEWLADEHTTV